MAFGLFGKKPEKMTAKPAAKPRPLDPSPATRSPAFEPSRPPPVQAPPAEEEDLDLDFTGIQLVEEADPMLAVIEEAAIAYADDHDADALAILVEGVRTPETSEIAERIWLMLFDLCQITGNRAAFGEHELLYAQRFEKQPPVWKESATAAAVTAAAGAPVAFKGDLVGTNSVGFDASLGALEKTPKLRLDLARVKVIDPDGCKRLCDLLARAKKLKREVELLGTDGVAALLQPLIAEHDRNQPYWQLTLELLQRQGRQEDFDNVALEFAITFEISPPAYEAPPKAPAKPGPKVAPVRPDDAFYLEGEILGGRIDGLDAWIKNREQAVIDLAGVTRMDFTSAGTLLNIISPHWQRGISITLRHPNRLVAELLGKVGGSDMATIVFAKRQ